MWNIFKELIVFSLKRKKYWMLPLLLILFSLGIILIVGQGSALSPFIYTIF